MVADLVDQNMSDNFGERILAVAPEVEQRPAIEPDHVGQFARLLDHAALGEPPAAKQAQEVEFALGAHLVERLVIREVDHLDDQTLAQAAKRSGEPIERRLAGQPKISVPTIALQGEVDGVHGLATSKQHHVHFTGPYQWRVLPNVGHNPPQEAPQQFADAILELIHAA